MNDRELARNLEKFIEDTSVEEPASDERVKVLDLKTSKDTLVPKEGGSLGFWTSGGCQS